MAYIQSGVLKTNKKDREAIAVFMQHAYNDIQYGLEGTYVPLGESAKDVKAAERELVKGEAGMKLVQWLIDTRV